MAYSGIIEDVLSGRVALLPPPDAPPRIGRLFFSVRLACKTKSPDARRQPGDFHNARQVVISYTTAYAQTADRARAWDLLRA